MCGVARGPLTARMHGLQSRQISAKRTDWVFVNGIVLLQWNLDLSGMCSFICNTFL